MARLTIGLALLCAVAMPAYALTSTVYGSGGWDTTGSGRTINVPLFDTEGGRYWLTGVTVSVYHTGAAYFAADNDRTRSRTATPQEIRSWSLTGSGVSSSVTNYTWNGTTQSLARDNGDGSFYFSSASPDGYDWGRVGYSGALASTTLVGSSYYTNYQATGGGTTAFTANITTITNSIVWGGGKSSSTQISNGVPNIGISIRVDYEWAAIPEPGTWAMMGVGLVGVALWRRRKRKQSPPGTV